MAILYLTSLANLVVGVGTRHSHQILLWWLSTRLRYVQCISDGDTTVLWQLHVDGLVQERRNSIANVLELCLSCTNPSMYCFEYTAIYQSIISCHHRIQCWPRPIIPYHDTRPQRAEKKQKSNHDLLLMYSWPLIILFCELSARIHMLCWKNPVFQQLFHSFVKIFFLAFSLGSCI